jgi:hypothetical protein
MLDRQGHDVRGSSSDGTGWEEWELQLVKRVPKVQESWSDFWSQMDRGRLELRWWEPALS